MDTDPAPQPAGLVRLRWIIWAVVAVAGVLALAFAIDRSGGSKVPAETASSIGGPFQLIAPDGSAVTEKTFAGKPFAIYFGYTRCPDVCPTRSC